MADDSIPIHVSKLLPGAQLRVAMKPGAAVEAAPDFTAASPSRARRAMGSSRASFYAFLIANDPATGTMVVDIEDRNPANPHLTVTLHYGSIQVLQRIVPRGRPVVETAPVSHPGAQALGTRMAQLFQQFYLVPVLF